MWETFDPVIETSNTQIGRVEKRLDDFGTRFADPDSFLEKADMAVQYYFGQHTEYSDISDFKNHLKELLNWYVKYLTLPKKEARKVSSKAEEIEETYDKIVFFWVFNPVAARRERVETGKTIENQTGEAKGLVVRFTGEVKKIF